MPIRVAGPDGKTYDFPDGTPPAVMERVLAKQYAKKPGVLQGAKDLAAQGAEGALGFSRSVADVFGAGNQASNWLRDREADVQEWLSPEAKRKQEASAAILAASKDGTIPEQVGGALRAFGANPWGNLAQGVGSVVAPVAGALGAVAAAPEAAAVGVGTGVGVGIGALSGAGSVKGSVYDAVYGAMTEHGVPPAQAKEAAKRAQSYGGENLDQILLAAGIGGVAGLAGAEGSAIRSAVMRRLGGEAVSEAAASQAAKGIVRRTLETGVTEGATEGVQSGQEQIAENLAARRAGFGTPLMSGVAGAAARDAIVGGLLGGAFGATERTRPGAEPTPKDTVAPPPVGGTFSPESFGLAPDAAQGYRAPAAEEEVDVARVDPRRRGPSVPVVDDGRGTPEPTRAAPDVGAGGLGGVGTPDVAPAAAEELVQPPLEPSPAQKLAAHATDQAAILGIPQEEQPAFVAGAVAHAHGVELPTVNFAPEQVPVAQAGADWIASERRAATEPPTPVPEPRRRKKVVEEPAPAAEITPLSSAPPAEIAPTVAVKPDGKPDVKHRGAVHYVTLADGTVVELTRDTNQFGSSNPQWIVDDPLSAKRPGWAGYTGSLGSTLPEALAALPARLASGRAYAAEVKAKKPAKAEPEAPAPEPKFTPADVAQAKETFAPTTEVQAYSDLEPRLALLERVSPEEAPRLRALVDSLAGDQNTSLTPPAVASMLDKKIQQLAESEADPKLRNDAAPAGAPVTPVSLNDAVGEVRRTSRGWTNSPVFEVVDTFASLPKALQAKAPSTMKGAYIAGPDKTYIVADRHGSLEEVRATVFHEALGHAGLEKAFGKELRALLDDLYATNPQLKQATDTWLVDNPDAYADMGTEERRARAVEEVLAETVQDGAPQLPAYRRAFAALKDLIRKFFVAMGKKPMAFSDNDVLAILAKASDTVTEGKATRVPGGSSDPRFSQKYPMGVKPAPEKTTEPQPAQQRAKVAAGKVGAYLERKLSDKYRGAKDYDAAMAAGESLTESVGKLSSRRAGAQAQLERQFFDPIMRMVKESKIDPQDMGMYLWARGAWDRNAKLGVDTLGQVEDGSGLTDAEAAQVFDEFDQRGQLQTLEKVAQLHDKLVDHMNALRVEAGLITAEEAKAQRDAQPYYTPMKGHASAGDMQIEEDVDPHAEFRARGKQRVAASEYMKARGRETMPFNPLFNLFQDAAHVADRAEINRASLPLLNNIKADVAAHEGLVEVNPRTGLGYFTDTHPDLQSNGMPVSMRGNKEYWHVRDNGESHYIKFAKTPEATELKRVFENITPAEMNGFMKAWSTVARLQRQTMTTWNPMFHLVAIGRDISDAVATAYAKQDERSSPAFGTKLGSLTAKYASSPTVMAATMSYVNGSTPATAQQATLHALIDQLITDGGTVGHSLIKDAETYAADAVKDLQRYAKAKKGDPVALASTGVRAVGKVMDALAKTGDIHARLATYMAGLQSGLSRTDAATLALDSSLNLTKRGEWAPVLDNLFYFFSPTVEGARKFARTAASGKGAVKVLGSFAALGAMATLWNGLVMGGDDDDDGRPNFMGVNQTLRQTRLILFYGHGADDYVAIPVGFLGALPMYAGGRITEGFMGVASDEQVGASVASTLLDMSKAAFSAMSPLRPQGGDLTEATASLTPTLVKPFADLAVNRNYFGSPIYNEQPYSTALKSQQARDSTGAGWKWLATTMNTLSGGDNTLPGFIDWQPEGYRYAFEALAGGPYRLGKDVYKAVSGTSDDTGLAAVPFVRNFVGKGSKYAPMNAYYKTTDDMKSILAKQDDASDEEWAALQTRHPLETDEEVLSAYDDASTELRALNRDMRDELDGVTNPQERKAIMDEYQLLKTEEYQRFNQIYQAKRKELGE